MARLAILAALLAGASALTTKRSLKLRGGADIFGYDIQTVGTGLIGASGLAAYISPKSNFKAYDMKVDETTALQGMRMVGAWQLALYAILAGDAGDAGTRSLTIAAASILATVPAFCDVLGAPKGPNVAWMGVLTYLASRGDLDARVPVALWLANGAQFHFAPQWSADFYKVSARLSPMGKSMIGLMGSMMLVGGTYLYALFDGKSQEEAFGWAFAVNGLFAAKWALTEADGLGAPKHGPLAWAAISAGLAYKALN